MTGERGLALGVRGYGLCSFCDSADCFADVLKGVERYSKPSINRAPIHRVRRFTRVFYFLNPPKHRVYVQVRVLILSVEKILVVM